jgi:hypothetical protein
MLFLELKKITECGKSEIKLHKKYSQNMVCIIVRCRKKSLKIPKG